RGTFSPNAGRKTSRCSSAADVRHLYLRRLRRLLRADLGVAVVAAAPHRGDRVGDLLVARAAADHGAPVAAARREEACVQLRLGRDPGARTRAPEGLRDGGED